MRFIGKKIFTLEGILPDLNILCANKSRSIQNGIFILLFAERVILAVDVAEVFIGHVSVDLRSDDIFMAQEFLDGS